MLSGVVEDCRTNVGQEQIKDGQNKSPVERDYTAILSRNRLTVATTIRADRRL